jgi:hypothetical protein
MNVYKIIGSAAAVCMLLTPCKIVCTVVLLACMVLSDRLEQ